MQNIQINNAEAENYIKSVYGNNTANLIDDFLLFVKTELVSKELKKGFNEVEVYKHHNVVLTDATDFLDELKNEH